MFKGSGFYITDYGKDGKGPRKAGVREAGRRDEARATPKADAKPAAKTDTEGRNQAGQEGRLRVSDALRAELARVASRLGADGVEFVLERPRDAGHGDLATNLAMVLAKRERANPRKTAERVLEELQLSPDLVARTEIAGPGFINFWLAQDQLAVGPPRPSSSRAPRYGRAPPAPGSRSTSSSSPPIPPARSTWATAAAPRWATPSPRCSSGPATRSPASSTSTTPASRSTGWRRASGPGCGSWPAITAAIPEGGYHGEYLQENAREVLDREGPGFADLPEEEGVRRCRALALRMQREEQDRDLADFGVRFDVMSSEQAIYDSGRVERALELLHERGLTFEAEGALWLRTTDFGDDKDRVLRKSDGSFTYLVPDIAYHIDKHDRGFDRVIDVWGADHHGYIPRMRAVLEALGYPPEFFDVALVQLVKVVRGGEEVKMSKRSGEFVTLRDLFEEVGVDAARYFFLMRKGASPLDFDVDLAKRQTDENPVFYVQMAHARLSGIFRTAERAPESVDRRARPGRAPGAAGRRAAQEAGDLSRDRGEGRARARAAPHHRLPPRAAPPWCTAGITTPARSARPKARPPSRPACCSPAPPASSWPTPSPCWASPPPTGCDRMSLLVVGSVALDSIFTPFGETADALGGSAVYFSVAGSLLHPVQVVGVVGSDYPVAELERLGAARHRLERRGARRRRELPLEGEVLLRPAEPGDARDPARRVRRLPAQAARGLPVGRVPVPRQHRSRAPARRPEPGARAQAGRVRHDELLDPEQEAAAPRAARAGWTC